MNHVWRSWVATCILFCLVAGTPATCRAQDAKAYVGNFRDDTVSVVDLSMRRVVATIPVARGPHGMAATPDGRTVYVGGDGSSRVDVIDVDHDRVVRSIDVGRSPHGMAIRADGRLLLVCVYDEDRVAFVDAASSSVVGSVAVAKPHTVALSPDGRMAYVASQQPGHFALVVIDITARTTVRTVPLIAPPRDLEFGFDGSRLYFTQAGVSAVQVLDPTGDRIVGQIPTGASPHIASVFRGAPAGVVVVQGPGEILLFDAATNAPTRSIAVGRQPHWVAAMPGASGVVVTNEGSDSVTLVDLASGRTDTVAVGAAPRKVVVAARPLAATVDRVSIANFVFAPTPIAIAPGSTVVWTNDDAAPHGIRFADASPGADDLLPKATFSRTFATVGTFDYVCSVHPFMQGQVIVRTP